MTDLFQYTPGTSLLHRMNPITKILLTLSVCVAAFLTDNLFVLLFLLAFDLLIGVVGRVERKAFSIFKGLFKVSLFLFVLQVLVTRRGNRIFWIITDEGLLTAATVVLRLLVVCLPLALVLAVTQVSDIAGAMVQVLHVPYAYAFTLTTAMSKEKRCFLALRDSRDVQDELLALIPFEIKCLFEADFGF